MDDLIDAWKVMFHAVALVMPIFVFAFIFAMACAYVPSLFRAGGAAKNRSFIAMTSIFGVVLGVLAALSGGFLALAKSGEGTLGGAILAVVVATLGVATSLFGDGAMVDLRRPLGAAAFLTCFLLSGLYWQLLRAAIGH